MKFIGRKWELQALEGLKRKKSASFVVVKGRRRIGKSRLVEEFGQNYTYYSFSGFPPTSESSAEMQRKAFALQLEKYFHVPVRYDSWYELFAFLSQQTSLQDAVILCDEISWMGSKDPEFLGALKTVWDQYFKQNPKIILIVCDSVSSWIDENILSSTGFVGRISLTLTVKELSLKESAMFWDGSSSSISVYEKLKVLAVTGGIPRYLEEIDPRLSAEDNIKRLCFDSSGILYQDFDQIFTDLFGGKATAYKKIIETLVEGSLIRETLIQKLDIDKNGRVSKDLDNLIKAGFIQRDFVWNIHKNTPPKLSSYRLSDNYLRFYLKYIGPNKDKIEKGFFREVHLSSFPGWSTLMGLAMENLVLNNRLLILEQLNIPSEIVVNDGAYFQRKMLRSPGCQIDYLIQTKLHELYVVEIKFHKSQLTSNVILETQEKIKRLIHPKNFSIRSALIHAGFVSASIEDSDYFIKIIDLTEMLR
jgi:AAA+ ATPase superfamily predicted ATPase